MRLQISFSEVLSGSYRLSDWVSHENLIGIRWLLTMLADPLATISYAKGRAMALGYGRFPSGENALADRGGPAR
jgi:hypothetical protein